MSKLTVIVCSLPPSAVGGSSTNLPSYARLPVAFHIIILSGYDQNKRKTPLSLKNRYGYRLFCHTVTDTSVRSDLQSDRIEYQHFKCKTTVIADCKSLYSWLSDCKSDRTGIFTGEPLNLEIGVSP